MTEPRLDQLYCTHCTYRTSALHRREGASGDQVFEETTRSGSVPREKSHDVYSRFASCLLFRVPGDMPSEAMVKHTAHSLQLRRLVYMPAVGGYRLLTQVSFRQTDTRGRPGASFAHVLIQDLKENPPWSALDALRLWGSKKWVIEDRPDLPFDLPQFHTLGEFDADAEPSINDEVLSSFLTAPADSEVYDPGKLIPSRWLQQSPEKRQKLLTNLVQAVLNLDLDRREQLLVVAEPSVAALLFYGVFRLLPPLGLVNKLSFSTYESHKDRMMTTLAATCFHDPVATDLPPDWYTAHARGVAFNTFKSDRHTPLKKPSQYAARIVKKLVEEGLPAIDEFHKICGQLGIGKPSELEGLSAIDGLVIELLHPKSKDELTLLEQGLPKEPGLRAFLRQKLADSFNLDDDDGHLPMLFGNPPHAMLVFRLLTEAGSDNNSLALEPVVQTMLARWPDEALGAFLRDKDGPKDRKVALLLSYVESHVALPPDAESLFFTRGAVCSKDKLLEELLRKLPGERLREFVEATYESCHKEECFCELLRALAPLYDRAEHQHAFQGLFSHPRFQNDPAERTQMFNAVLADKGLRDKLAKADQFESAPIAAHLKHILNSLHRAPGQLDHNLELLEALKHFISEDRGGRLSAWHTVSSQLKQLQQLNAAPQGVLSRLMGSSNKSEKTEAAKALAFAAKKAIPMTGEYDDNRPGDVYKLVKFVVGEAGLPEGLHAGLHGVFLSNTWPSRKAHKSRLDGVFTVKWGIMATSALVLLAILGLAVPQLRRTLSQALQVAGIGYPRPKPQLPKPISDPLDTPPNVPHQNTQLTENKLVTQVKLSKEENKNQPVPKVEQKEPVAQPSIAIAEKDDGGVPKKREGDPVKKTEEVAKRPALPVTWPEYFDLPALPQQSQSTGPPPDGMTLRQWLDDKGRRLPTEQVGMILRDTTISVTGIEDVNELLAKVPDADLNKLRLEVQVIASNATNHSTSVRVFGISVTDFEVRRRDKRKAEPPKTDILCIFEIDSNGLHFEWTSTPEAGRQKLQDMVRYCWLEIERKSPSDFKRIPLVVIQPPQLIPPKTQPTTVPGMVNAKTYKTITTGPWEQQPANNPFGFNMFKWSVTKLVLSVDKSDLKPLEAILSPGDRSQVATVGTMTDKIKLPFESIEVEVTPTLDQMTNVSNVSVRLSGKLPATDTGQALKKLKDEYKKKLGVVLLNPEKPPQPLAIRPTVYPGFAPVAWVNEMSDLLKRRNPEFKILVQAPKPPLGFVFEEKTNMTEIKQSFQLNDPKLKMERENFVKEYTTWACENVIRPGCDEYEKMKAELGPSGDTNSRENEARQFLNGIRSIEVEGLSRLVHGKWTSVPLRTKIPADAPPR